MRHWPCATEHIETAFDPALTPPPTPHLREARHARPRIRSDCRRIWPNHIRRNTRWMRRDTVSGDLCGTQAYGPQVFALPESVHGAKDTERHSMIQTHRCQVSWKALYHSSRESMSCRTVQPWLVAISRNASEVHPIQLGTQQLGSSRRHVRFVQKQNMSRECSFEGFHAFEELVFVVAQHLQQRAHTHSGAARAPSWIATQKGFSCVTKRKWGQ